MLLAVQRHVLLVPANPPILLCFLANLAQRSVFANRNWHVAWAGRGGGLTADSVFGCARLTVQMVVASTANSIAFWCCNPSPLPALPTLPSLFPAAPPHGCRRTLPWPLAALPAQSSVATALNSTAPLMATVHGHRATSFAWQVRQRHGHILLGASGREGAASKASAARRHKEPRAQLLN